MIGGDCQGIVNWSCKNPSYIQGDAEQALSEISHLEQQFKAIEYQWIPRSCNMVAHALPQWSKSYCI